MLTAAAIVLAVNALTSLLRKYIFPKWGKSGVQSIVFVLAVVGALYYSYAELVPSLKTIVTAAAGIFSLAVSLYEVLWSKLGFDNK